MADKKRGLGRGAPRGDELARIPVDLLQRGKYQPRIDLRPESLQELADSIRAQGIVQPIVVRPLGARGGRVAALRDHRRRAPLARRADGGPRRVPAVVRRVPDEAAVAMALIENIQRENLNPLEEARALDRLIREFELTHQQAAEAVGRSRAAVSNLLRLLELPEEVPRWSRSASSRWATPARCSASRTAASRPRSAPWSARRACRCARPRRWCGACSRRRIRQGGGGEPRRDPDIARLEGQLADKLGAKVELRHSTSGKGRLVISYHSLDELDGILSHIQCGRLAMRLSLALPGPQGGWPSAATPVPEQAEGQPPEGPAPVLSSAERATPTAPA
jgi:ParB family transcriptional regulator, chromosome partitioning protein